jgi:hypothetical protein
LKYTIPVSDIIVVVVMGSTFPSRYLLSLFFIFLLSSSPTTLSLVTSVASFGESSSSSFFEQIPSAGRACFVSWGFLVCTYKRSPQSKLRRDFRSLSTLLRGEPLTAVVHEGYFAHTIYPSGYQQHLATVPSVGRGLNVWNKTNDNLLDRLCLH